MPYSSLGRRSKAYRQVSKSGGCESSLGADIGGLKSCKGKNPCNK